MSRRGARRNIPLMKISAGVWGRHCSNPASVSGRSASTAWSARTRWCCRAITTRSRRYPVIIGFGGWQHNAGRTRSYQQLVCAAGDRAIDMYPQGVNNAWGDAPYARTEIHTVQSGGHTWFPGATNRVMRFFLG